MQLPVRKGMSPRKAMEEVSKITAPHTVPKQKIIMLISTINPTFFLETQLQIQLFKVT
jgi:hypothetical protein